MLSPEVIFRSRVVYLILINEPDKALEILSNHYGIVKPKLTVGMPKRYSRNPACYVANKCIIHVSQREILSNPHVILHEFYHHLRNVSNAQGGIEKYADSFARKFIQDYREAKKYLQ
ncbi:MAG: hypothetical protein P8Y18_10730 [Candidatus Bathyarchaeota archaeon]